MIVARGRRILAVLALTAALAAPAAGRAPEHEAFEVALPDGAARASAQRLGLGFLETQDGDWYGVAGDRDAAAAAGLRTRDATRPLLYADRDAHLPTPEEVEARLGTLVDAGAASWLDVGVSREGRALLGVRMGSGDTHVRVLGGHHGNEGSSTEVALALAEALATDGVPDGLSVWIVPQVNPDGMAAASRYNARGVDLNRNYGYEWTSNEYAAGDAPFSEPETRAIRALVAANDAAGAVSLHSGETNIGWVWNWTSLERAPDEDVHAAVAEAYAERCTAPGFWTTNGADWYVTHGDTTDWTYGRYGQHDLTVEVTYEKSPPVELVDTYVGWHLDALRGLLTRPPDLRARVVDASSGRGLRARVSRAGGLTAWTGPDGALARWTDGDSDGWVAWAPGYAEAPLAAETALTPVALLSVRPEPALLSRGDGPTRVTLDGAPDGVPLVLSLPGEADVTVPGEADGGWLVDPAVLAPGAWTLTTAAGVVPRGLFVGEVDDRVRVDAVEVDGAALVVTGAGFGRGTLAWSLSGADRAMVPLAALSEARDALRFASPPDGADVLIWSNGAWLAILDASGDAEIDEDAPLSDPPAAQLDARLFVAGMCGTSAPAGATALLLAGLMIARRARRPAGAAAR